MNNVKVTLIIPLHNPCIDFLTENLKVAVSDKDEIIQEILLIDDGSDVSVERYFSQFRKLSSKIFLIRQSNGGPANARNTGIVFASSEIVAFLDSDCLPEEHWIHPLVRPIITGNAVATGGTVLTYYQENTVSRFVDFRDFLRKPVQNQDGVTTNLITANSAFSKRIFSIIGRFDERLRTSEDIDLTYRLIQAGYQDKILYVPNSIVRHRHRSSIKALWKQQFGYGYGIMLHCLYKKRNPAEINFIYPTFLNAIIYMIEYFFYSISLAFTTKRGIRFLERYVMFPFLEYTRRIAKLLGGINAYYFTKWQN